MLPLVGLIGALALAAATAANAGAALAAAFAWVLQTLHPRRAAPSAGATPPVSASSVSTPLVDAPFVSIHMAIHNEPPALVTASLDALAALDYDRFEVVVIDNNTRDRDAWLPVEAHAARLGPRFRFLHRMDVKGAKAGALNIALDVADPRTRYVAIVDADYQVSAHFLSDALSYLGGDVRFVQFPQAYRRTRGAELLAAELGDYFRTFPSAANRADASLLTGTLSVIEIEALRSVGGWPTRSITEDAALGLALLRQGARGRYVDRVMGRGLLPLDLCGLRTQRRRWAAGNVQVLLSMLAPGGVEAAPGARAAVFGQLTAWAGFMAIPLAALAVDALVRGLAGPERRAAAGIWTFIDMSALVGFVATLACVALRSLASSRPATMLVSASLLWTSSLGWLPALMRRPLTFRRTPKASGGPGGGWSLDGVGSVLALAVAAAFLWLGSPGIAAVLALSASGLVTAPFVDRALRRAAAGGEERPCRA